MRPRKKASDIFAEGTFPFAKKVSFEEAFPEIEDVRVEVEEFGHGVYEENRRSVYPSKTHLGEYIDCRNPLCYNGGFSIGDILREMVAHGETELEIRKMCQGNEASPKGRKVYRKCLNMFTVKVSLTYRKPKPA